MAIQLLSATDEAELNQWGGMAWLSTSSSWRKAIRERLLEAVDRLVEFQEDVKAPNPLDPSSLAELMAIVLRYDKSFIGEFERRNPANPDWDKLCRLMARGLVQRWFADKDISADGIAHTSAWAVDPEYLEALNSLLALAKEEGNRAHEDVAAHMPQGEWARELPDDPEVISNAEASLRSLLEEHQDLAHEADDGDIPLDAQEREIEKAALLELRFRDLRAVAKEREVPLYKSKDRLAEAIVNHAQLSREEIAELILRHDPDNPFERSMITHLIPLNEAPDLGVVSENLQRLLGKYARLRVARWFVFEDAVQPVADQLLIKGHLRGYRTKAVLDTDDYKINATPLRSRVRIRLREGRRWAELDARYVTDVRDLRVVLNRGAEVRTLGAVDPRIGTMEGHSAGWDSKSLWFLDFLSRALEDPNTEIFNFEMAHFERVGIPGDKPGKPQIDKVELRGQHVGSHRDSCSLITAGRRLLEVIVRLRFRPTGQEDFFVPVQISLFSDRATIATAPTRDVPSTVVGTLHRDLVKKVRNALEREVEYTDLKSLAEKIVERAEQASPAEEADLFAPKEQGEEPAVEVATQAATGDS